MPKILINDSVDGPKAIVLPETCNAKIVASNYKIPNGVQVIAITPKEKNIIEMMANDLAPSFSEPDLYMPVDETDVQQCQFSEEDIKLAYNFVTAVGSLDRAQELIERYSDYAEALAELMNNDASGGYTV